MTGHPSVTVSDFTHYCGMCTSLIREDAEKCGECSTARPPAGWKMLQGSPYPWLGRILDNRYILNQFLGDGATGYVYRGKAMQIHRSFAAKIVDTRRYGKPEFEAELLRRFRMEVDAMSRMRNPHVVNIYEAMQLADNIFVLVMDFVDGRTLQDLLDRVGRIKYKRALDIVRQIANGLFEAHSLGFIHRDLKPDNIMVERLPAAGFFARILDFGIVHMMDSVADTGGFRGTPLYASPEQCMGDPKIDHRSDIYSLGCVFFHCLTGQPPFPGTESLKVMDAHVNDPPPSLFDILPGSKMPVSLDRLLQTMLSKEPGKRPKSMQEVIQQIDRLMMDPTFDERAVGHQETEAADLDLGRRMSTGDFPAAPSTGVTEEIKSPLLRPIIEVHLPALVAVSVKGFTATALNRAGDCSVAADQMNRIHVMSLKNDGVYYELAAAPAMITAVCMDLASKRVFGASMDGRVYQWTIQAGASPQVIGKLDDRVFAIDFDRRGNRVACGTEQGRVVVFDLNKKTETLLVPSGPSISALALSPTENAIFVGFWGGALALVDLNTKRAKALDPLPSNPVSMVISDDGYIAAVLDGNHHVRILSLVHGSSFFELTASFAQLRSLAFDAKSQLLGMGVNKTAVSLWDIRAQSALANL